MKQTRYNYRGRPVGRTMAYYNELNRLRNVPTAKQKKFLASLVERCKERGIEVKVQPHTRCDYSNDIKMLLKLLGEEGNGKTFDTVVTVSDGGFRGASETKERLEERV